ncbi:MAG: copper oxidase, partial [Alphaproteobacteria bacterium]|nr:copper oxidase [Alphaproteobacteria bacterium]
MISRLLRTISNRRSFLSAGALLPLAPLVAGSSSGAVASQHVGTHPATQSAAAHIGGMTTVGTVDHRRNGFDPHDL